MCRTPRNSPAPNRLTTTRHSTSRLGVVLLMFVALTWANCGGDKPGPTPVSPTPVSPTPTPTPTLTRVSIGGNLTLSALGETSQLTGSAVFSDNTTKDVTSTGRWDSGDARVITISPTGVVTVVGFGATWVSFLYQTKGAGGTVTATRQGTFVVAGRVREPGAGGLLDARVLDTITGRSAVTNADGEFSLAELPRLQAHLKSEKDGYEPAELDTVEPNVDLPLQRIVRLTAGETAVPGALAPNDLAYTVGNSRCSPCRMIRVIVPRAGTVHVRVTWTPVAAKLNLFAEGQVVAGQSGELNADVAIGTAREVLMYVGIAPPVSLTGHTPFTFETSLR